MDDVHQIVPFSNVLSIVNGKNQKAVEAEGGQYPIYGSGGEMGRANDYLCDADTVIIGRKGSINNPIYVEEPCWNVDTAFGLVADREKLLPKYLYYFCVKFDFTKLNTTVTIPSLTKANLLKVNIPLPPLAEQKRIAEVLNKINAMKRNAEARVQKLDLLVKSRFVEMFGDVEKKVAIGDACVVMNGFAFKSERYVPSGIRVIRITNVQQGFVEDITPKYYPDDSLVEIEKYMLQEDDLLISLTGNVGRVALLAKEYLPAGLNQRVGCLRIRNAVPLEKRYLFWALNNASFEQACIDSSKGIAQKNMSTEWLKEYQLSLPPLALQREFAAFVEQVEKLKATAQRECEQVDLLYRAQLQEYFE